ncbi:putative flippase GtrA [Geodermatophilus tzadiensis]|uniref:Putative flippase GtrA n=1 Tax=Geodermatophilus tzadiensis TaxID=1137988 RepID=A0A2T0U1X9_9ACTN|nr:GtrA family protein [Geodermatophilus tzadiensis]PRY51931.1 putative flippase GtrA [Geodermatophilus tzadiensis]
MTTGTSRLGGPAREAWRRYRSFVLYQLIGVSGVLLDLVLFLLLYNVLGLHEQLATVLSTSAGITNNFLLNSYLNFRVRDGMLRRFLRFYAVGLVGIGLVAVLLLVFHTWLGVDANVVKVVSLPVVAVLQFLLNKRWSFR